MKKFYIKKFHQMLKKEEKKQIDLPITNVYLIELYASKVVWQKKSIYYREKI